MVVKSKHKAEGMPTTAKVLTLDRTLLCNKGFLTMKYYTDISDFPQLIDEVKESSQVKDRNIIV